MRVEDVANTALVSPACLAEGSPAGRSDASLGLQVTSRPFLDAMER